MSQSEHQLKELERLVEEAMIKRRLFELWLARLELKAKEGGRIMTKQEEIREETENHIRACLKVSGIEKDISNSLSKSLMFLLDGLGVKIKVFKEGKIKIRHTEWSVGWTVDEPLIKEGIIKN